MEWHEKIEIAAWQLISQTEKGLRQLVLQVFLNTFGDNWKLGYLNRYDRLPDKKNRLHIIFERLEHAYQRDMEQYGSLAMNLTLLDETYIHQLFDYFILFSWEDIFQPIFQKEKNYWKKVKDNLELIRNPMAHQKMELLLESEIKKAEEYCREISSIIERSESAENFPTGI